MVKSTKSVFSKKARLSSLAVTLAFSIALFPASSSAVEEYEFFTGVRQLGMGGAYTAVVNDETSLLTNPAGLGKIRDVTITIADPELHGSFNNTDIAKLDSASKIFGIQSLLEVLKQSPGKHWHAKAQFFPSIVGPNFGFGIHAKYSYDAEVDSTGTVYRLDYTNDYAAALGFCFRFFGGIVKLGVAGRLVDRIEVHKDLDANATALELKQVASEGMGMAADLGLIITAPIAGLPAISAVLRDVGGTTYTMNDGLFSETTTRPAATKQKLDTGLSISPILSNRVRMQITADYHDILGIADETGEVDPMKRIHAGLEFNFSDFFFLRGGMNQRYWTSGIELASERFQIQLASYGEELGTFPALKEDRRWVGKFTIRF